MLQKLKPYLDLISRIDQGMVAYAAEGGQLLTLKSAARRGWSRSTLIWARIRYPLGAVVSWMFTIVGGISAIGGLWAGAITSQSGREAVWGWALAAIAVTSFGAFTVQNFRRAKGRALASTIRQQAYAADILRNTRSFLRAHALVARQGGQVPPDVLGRARAEIRNVLTTYAEVFSATTGTFDAACA